MKVTILIARILLGLAFFAGGLNHIINGHTMPAPGDASTWINLMINTRYMTFVGLLELIGGLLLLVGRFVPLGLTILGPIIVNIVLFDALIAHQGVAIGLVCVVLEAFLIWAYRFSFKGLFDASPTIS